MGVGGGRGSRRIRGWRREMRGYPVVFVRARECVYVSE